MVDKLKNEIRVPVWLLSIIVGSMLAMASGLISLGVSVNQIKINARDISDTKRDINAIKEVLINTVAASVNQVQNNKDDIKEIKESLKGKIDEKQYRLDMQEVNARLAYRGAKKTNS